MRSLSSLRAAADTGRISPRILRVSLENVDRLTPPCLASEASLLPLDDLAMVVRRTDGCGGSRTRVLEVTSRHFLQLSTSVPCCQVRLTLNREVCLVPVQAATRVLTDSVDPLS